MKTKTRHFPVFLVSLGTFLALCVLYMGSYFLFLKEPAAAWISNSVVYVPNYHHESNGFRSFFSLANAIDRQVRSDFWINDTSFVFDNGSGIIGTSLSFDDDDMVELEFGDYVLNSVPPVIIGPYLKKLDDGKWYVIDGDKKTEYTGKIQVYDVDP